MYYFDSERKKWLGPLTWAVALHLAFLILSAFISLYGYFDFNEAPKLNFKLNEVDMTKHIMGSSRAPRLSPYLGRMRFASDRPGESLESLKNQPSFLPEQKEAVVETAQEKIGEKKTDLFSMVNKDYDTLLMETQKRESGDEVKVSQRSTAQFYQKQADQSVRMSPVTTYGLIHMLQGPLARLQLYSPKNVSMNPEEGMPGFTPSGTGGSGHGWPGSMGSAGGFGNMDFGAGVGEDKEGIAKYESLDNVLDIDVYTYQDPKTSEKYFMIKIFPKKGQRAFKVMPKEILFAVDASLSISPDRLDEFKRGIRYCLEHLNKGDTFNLIAFKDTATFFSPHSIAAGPEDIKNAEHFVEGLTSSQRTDVYLAFKKIVEVPLDRVPSDVILISDGRPTHGVVDSREVIKLITKINRKTRPVFAFSGGARVNRYLLDFIAYQNRGWSQFVKSAWDIHTALAGFYDKIKDPIFLNLRYRLNNVSEEEVFPKSLPDFTVGAEFTLFGAYKDEDTFAMQFLGDVEGKTKELVFTRSLKDAKPGSEDIMRGWAFNKVYYLISRVTMEGPKPELLKQIDDLSRRYRITTPYSPDLKS